MLTSADPLTMEIQRILTRSHTDTVEVVCPDGSRAIILTKEAHAGLVRDAMAHRLQTDDVGADPRSLGSVLTAFARRQADQPAD